VLLVEVLDVPLAAATATAFLTSVVVNFGLNRVLAGGAGLLGPQVLRYALLLGANLLLTVAVVSGAAAVGVPYVLAKGAFVLASTAWNYVLYRRWVFAAGG
jgi:putative flippase GtrA